jgi:hypothetical protein
MDGFLVDTGVVGSAPARRYLWTDAFAVCTRLELGNRGLTAVAGGDGYADLALRLVDQVHHTLGRHRDDDPRVGWLSGLDDAEGEAHPTAGGLRIGKHLPERPRGELLDQRVEWDRDGQYFHYLTRWMHALLRIAERRGNEPWLRWSLELAQVAHDGFVRKGPESGRRYMPWKMSIDLSRALVDVPGQHDPLDGYVTLLALVTHARQTGFPAPSMNREISDFRDMAGVAGGRGWATDDPLGLGGLLVEAWHVTQLHAMGVPGLDRLFTLLLDSAVAGYRAFRVSPHLEGPIGFRLPFRELGLALGSHASERILEVARSAEVPGDEGRAVRRLLELDGLRPTARDIEATWLEPENQQLDCWKDHADINTVMLATSLVPDGYLRV